MSEPPSDDDQVAQGRDALLRRILKTPPQSRAETAERVRRARGNGVGRRGRPPKVRKPA
ncbi:MAG: hypothetical protein ACRD06_06385 [Terriglobia bacterium]